MTAQSASTRLVFPIADNTDRQIHNFTEDLHNSRPPPSADEIITAQLLAAGF